MITIRAAVYETNSSSCHVVTVLSDYELEQLYKGNLALAIHLSQGDKTIAVAMCNSRFKYELNRCQFYRDDDGEYQYADLDRKAIESLSDEIWAFVMADMTTPVEGFNEKVAEAVKKYSEKEPFVENVLEFVHQFAGKYQIQHILEKTQKYEMDTGEIMNFSCVEMDC
jgi:hypothetical protein